MIIRTAAHLVEKKLQNGRVLLVHGPRRVGKTTLLRRVRDTAGEPVLWLNGESQATHRLLADRTEANYRAVVGAHKLVIVDEAQMIPDIGLVLKLMVDEMPDVRFLVSGSATFDLFNKAGEPLTGRYRTVRMFPFSVAELVDHYGLAATDAGLENRLVYGCYPEVVLLDSAAERQEYLVDLMQSYLLKDLLVLDGIRQSGKLLQLLRLVAFQIGQDVSLEELGRSLGLSKNTVERYLNLLEQIFVLYRLGGFSRNLRKEVVKSSRWFFVDNGVRNAVIGDFRPLALRTDQGMLWENAMAAERVKRLFPETNPIQTYFWRTYDQQELDWVEEEAGQVRAFEFKFSEPERFKVPAAWRKTYPDAPAQCVHRGNYLNWLAGGG